MVGLLSLALSGRGDSLIDLCVAVLIGILLSLMPLNHSRADPNAFEYNRLLGRGMNLGDALDAPEEGAWGVTLKDNYFRIIKDAGFESIRIPIRWSVHAQPEPPFTIDSTFFERVDWAINQALSRNLSAVIDIHHYAEVDHDPVRQAPRLVALWKQIAARYQKTPPTLFFELFNEPHDQLTDERWEKIIPDLLQAIRETNPKRMIIIGPAYWNNLEHLPFLQLPQNDRRLIVTFHYYHPFKFTYQGADWVPNSDAWRGTKWGAAQEREDLNKDFEKVAAWARQRQRPIYLGEFGVNGQAEMKWRVLWTTAVAREAEKLGFSWSYWNFYTSFGAYDPVAGVWRKPLLRSLQNK